MPSTAPTRTPRNVTGAPTDRPLIEPSKTTAARVVGLEQAEVAEKDNGARAPGRNPPRTKAPIAVCLSAAIYVQPFLAVATS